MDLFISVVLAGITNGLIYGMFGFGLVFLFKTTSVANFGLGNIAAIEAFIVYEVHNRGVPFGLSIVVGLVAAIPLTSLVYFTVMRPGEASADLSSLIIRTVALFLGLFAFMNTVWSTGQPFGFPSFMPTGGFKVGSVAIPWSDLVTLGIAAALALAALYLFRRTTLGLKFLAMSQDLATARLLGVQVTRLSICAWAFAGVIALVVGLVVAPVQLLSSDMMDPLMLYGFAAAVLGGLTSLEGAFVGGVTIGIISDLVTTYVGGDFALLSAFVVLLVTLFIRPAGLFGQAQLERL